MLSRLSEKLGEVIVSTIRNSDVVCRYGKGQYLVLLMNTTAENCVTVEDRINRKFRSVNQRNKIDYHVSVVTYDPFIE